MRKAVLSAVICAGLCVTYAQALTHPTLAGSPLKEGPVPILLYHHIQDVPATASHAMHRWSMPPKRFEAQIEWVAKNGFHPITMAQLLAHLKHQQILPVKPIVLSFDDGWREHYSVAFPILKKHNFAATFFIITGSVGHSVYMNWDQVKEMSDAGMDIEAHTVSHPNLSALPREKAWREISESKKTLESQLNKPVTILAYPYGHFDDQVIAMVKKAGFEGGAAVEGLNGGYIFRADQSFTLTRYALEGNDSLAYIARAKGFDVK